MTQGEMLEQRMRERGVRVTAQRALILETLADMSGHPSAQEVYERAKSKLPGLNLATVYRNLYSLHEAGLVDLMSTGPDVQRFAYRDPRNLHAHLVCRRCEQVQEIPHDVFDNLKAFLAKNYNFLADSRHMALSGLCLECSSTQED
ncbi:MAG: Fur family transcriptional regulator [Anaerolineales bacterium]